MKPYWEGEMDTQAKENFRKIINSLHTEVEYLENEIKVLKEQHHAELQEWQATCSALHDELLEAVSELKTTRR